jgi:nicotinate-nucleotide--dimethylbenzimidazole phosphoribosyltransferase
MTLEACQKAMNKGKELVSEEAARGCNTIGFGEMGIGNTSAASLLMHAFTGIPIELCVGAGAGLDQKGVAHKLAVLREVAERYHPTSPTETLATFGGLEIAMMTGALLEGYRQKMVLLVDGFIASAAVLTAWQYEPDLLSRCLFCHHSQEKGHERLLHYLKAKPLLNLNMRLGEGTGVAVAMPVIRNAIDFLREMSSFEEAGVSNSLS